MKTADCILLLGYDPIEMRADWIRAWAADVAIDFCHATIDHGTHACALHFAGDVSAASRALTAGLDTPLADLWQNGEIATARTALAKAFAPRPHWGPHAIFAALDTKLPANAVVTADSGAHRILLTQMFHANRPGHLLQSAAFCTMGVALPLAIGVKRATPKTPLVAVVGDAGLDMAPGDLATLRDMHLPITIVALVDNSLTLIARKQAAMKMPEIGVDFGRTNFISLAAAYGGIGVEITNSHGFSRALKAAANRQNFTILACKINKHDYDGAF